MTNNNWCDFYKDIEADPFAIVKGLTIRRFLLAKEHIKTCKDCSDIVDRVIKTSPPTKPFIGEN